MYNFQHLQAAPIPPEYLDLNQVVTWFQSKDTPVEQLVQILNVYCSNWDQFIGGSAVFNGGTLFRNVYWNAMLVKTNTAVLVAARDYFQVPADTSNSVGYALCVQPLPRLLEIMEPLTWLNSAQHLSLMRETYRRSASNNPDPRVHLFVHDVTSNWSNESHIWPPQARRWFYLRHNSTWMEQLAQESESYFSYLVRDIRQYLLKPYLDDLESNCGHGSNSIFLSDKS